MMGDESSAAATGGCNLSQHGNGAMAGIWCKSESGIHLVGLREKYLGVRGQTSHAH